LVFQQQLASTNASKQRSDSDSESVFTDDDEWAHPLPLRENVGRSLTVTYPKEYVLIKALSKIAAHDPLIVPLRTNRLC